MTEEVYESSMETFTPNKGREKVREVPLLQEGLAAMERFSNEMGLGMDSFDLDYYARHFLEEVQRNPTDVELFDIAQSNSEHCRHWFFRGSLSVDGTQIDSSLIDKLRSTLEHSDPNSTIAFADNSSAIRGGLRTTLRPVNPGEASPLAPQTKNLDIIFTAETHNFPSGVAPFPGAETGTGGRIRDTHATGKGSYVGVATAGYSTGCLNLDDFPIPGEDGGAEALAPNLATPKDVLIEASNGASDYGNKFGEPVVAGFCRTLGLRVPGTDERREYLKPIMFSGGLGAIESQHSEKVGGDVGSLVVKIGGPAYRIGMGGGAASSKAGGEEEGLDFDAVQRGDAEMAQKLNRVVRACAELGAGNPILSIHDQGAGGNCNVVKEIIEPSGAKVDVRAVVLGDETLSALEVWGAEYQENDCLLVPEDMLSTVEQICTRERCPFSVMGSIDGSGTVRVTDAWAREDEPQPVDLRLDTVLGKLPTKHFELSSPSHSPLGLSIPASLDARRAFWQVALQPSVCSKRFLTTKVDRCVTGLVAQQQCCGPLLVPVADYAASAISYVDGDQPSGAATAIGEQPLKGIASAAKMARLSLAEAVTNLAGASTDGRKKIKASGNWMWAPKLDGEGGPIVEACDALCDCLSEIGIAVDGGKDSLSMGATAGGETVKAPGTLVVSLYVSSPDVSAGVTPDVKRPGSSSIILADINQGKRRLGGSALLQSLAQVGAPEECPDVDSVHSLAGAFDGVQRLVKSGHALAVHDVSDGGIVMALSEMAFPTGCGIQANVDSGNFGGKVGIMEGLFAEEPMILLEVERGQEQQAIRTLQESGCAKACHAGWTKEKGVVSISVDGHTVLEELTHQLRKEWEATALRLEEEQASLATVGEERDSLGRSPMPWWHLSHRPGFTEPSTRLKPRVAIVREEGSNGDREMAAAMSAAGFEPWDVTVTDLLSGKFSLSQASGAAFVGGFSFGDVLGSGTGWAASANFHPKMRSELDAFLARQDTFSLGVCNGCQLMALLGMLPGSPTFMPNLSGRFESRFATLSIQPESPSPLLDGMGGTVAGIWCAHGEGRVTFADESADSIASRNLAPLRYVDASCEPTESYPYNPNGSPLGIAGLTSEDGRHLAMMPHPERSFLTWQLPHVPEHIHLNRRSQPSPWLTLFQNAHSYVVHHRSSSS